MRATKKNDARKFSNNKMPIIIDLSHNAPSPYIYRSILYNPYILNDIWFSQTQPSHHGLAFRLLSVSSVWRHWCPKLEVCFLPALPMPVPVLRGALAEWPGHGKEQWPIVSTRIRTWWHFLSFRHSMVDINAWTAGSLKFSSWLLTNRCSTATAARAACSSL